MKKTIIQEHHSYLFSKVKFVYRFAGHPLWCYDCELNMYILLTDCLVRMNGNEPHSHFVSHNVRKTRPILPYYYTGRQLILKSRLRYIIY